MRRLLGFAGFDLGQKLGGADPVYGGRLDKGRIEGFKVGAHLLPIQDF